ncbi:MAG: hypothetical protein HQM10_20835 [Candidatus Riflebacteria bacterium]|nr:hypothetical protein [Candidatus Riflebacteria bacterium]
MHKKERVRLGKTFFASFFLLLVVFFSIPVSSFGQYGVEDAQKLRDNLAALNEKSLNSNPVEATKELQALLGNQEEVKKYNYFVDYVRKTMTDGSFTVSTNGEPTREALLAFGLFREAYVALSLAGSSDSAAQAFKTLKEYVEAVINKEPSFIQKFDEIRQIHEDTPAKPSPFRAKYDEIDQKVVSSKFGPAVTPAPAPQGDAQYSIEDIQVLRDKLVSLNEKSLNSNPVEATEELKALLSNQEEIKKYNFVVGYLTKTLTDGSFVVATNGEPTREALLGYETLREAYIALSLAGSVDDAAKAFKTLKDYVEAVINKEPSFIQKFDEIRQIHEDTPAKPSPFRAKYDEIGRKVVSSKFGPAIGSNATPTVATIDPGSVEKVNKDRIPAGFNWYHYLLANPDVYAAAGGESASKEKLIETANWHVSTYAASEGRALAPFTGDHYLLMNKDVKDAKVDPFEHYHHFVLMGSKEPRWGTCYRLQTVDFKSWEKHVNSLQGYAASYTILMKEWRTADVKGKLKLEPAIRNYNHSGKDGGWYFHAASAADIDEIYGYMAWNDPVLGKHIKFNMGIQLPQAAIDHVDSLLKLAVHNTTAQIARWLSYRVKEQSSMGIKLGEMSVNLGKLTGDTDLVEKFGIKFPGIDISAVTDGINFGAGVKLTNDAIKSSVSFGFDKLQEGSIGENDQIGFMKAFLKSWIDYMAVHPGISWRLNELYPEFIRRIGDIVNTTSRDQMKAQWEELKKYILATKCHANTDECELANTVILDLDIDAAANGNTSGNTSANSENKTTPEIEIKLPGTGEIQVDPASIIPDGDEGSDDTPD